MPDVTTATQPTNEIRACCFAVNSHALLTGTQVFCSRQRPYTMHSFGLKFERLYPCTVCTSDDFCLSVSCFAHDLM